MATPDSDAVVQVIDQPGQAGPDNSRARLLLVLQVIAAAGAGVLLAFLVDYLDDTFHDGEVAAATLGVPHLASVPVERST
jgi:capsular polysaccharide biosynthesis protein